MNKVGTGGNSNHSRTRSSRNRRKQSSSQHRQQQQQQQQQLAHQQQTPLNAQTERDKCKKSNKIKSNKKVLQIELPNKAQPQPQLEQQQEQQQPEQKQSDALVNQKLANSSQKTQATSEASKRRTVAHNVDAPTRHTSSSDASTASCDSDSDEAVSEKLASMCHHCLRPQIELQLRHLRPQQRRQWSRLLNQQRSKRRNSKSRKEVSWSGGGGFGGNDNAWRDGDGGGGPVGVGIGGYAESDAHAPTNTYTTGVHWSRRDVSAAVRYRCPQVGPKPAPYHFHHPQQLHNAYQLQLLLQQCEYVPPTYHHHHQQQLQQHQQQHRRQTTAYNCDMNFHTSSTTIANTATTLTIESDIQTPAQKQQPQQRNQNIQLNQNLHAMSTAPTTIKTATSIGSSKNYCTSNTSLAGRTALSTGAAGNRFALQPHTDAMPLGRTARGTVSDSELQLQQQPTTSEPPSLVKKFKPYFPDSCSEQKKSDVKDSPG